MAYTKQANDKGFRRINLRTSFLPQFQPFSSAAQTLDCQEEEVLEVERDDGTTVIIEKPNKRMISYLRMPPNRFLIPSNVPSAHMGICKAGCPQVRYMLPESLPEEGHHYNSVLVPEAANAELCGDKYFAAAYQLVKQN